MAGIKGSRGSIFQERAELEFEWFYERNIGIDPYSISAGSGKKYWWKCPKNSLHIYEMQVYARCDKSKPKNCPFCARQRTHVSESLNFLYPDVMKQWDWQKNSIDPKTIFPGSIRKVWWICEKGHSWETTPQKVVHRGQGCPYCSGHRPSSDYNLAVLHPDLLNEWDYQKNNISPSNLTPRSSKRVHWKCSEGKDHEWEATPSMRVGQGTGCPFCQNLKVSITNNLLNNFPEIAAEWHPTLNGKVLPSDVVFGSEKVVWWQCSLRSEHEWKTSVYSRSVEKSGCPKCNPQKSRPELRIFTEIKYLFPDCESGTKIHGRELDILIPSLRVGIEYDGSYWHKGKLKKDESKNKFMDTMGITLIRVREKPLRSLSKLDICISSTKFDKKSMNQLIRSLVLARPKIEKLCLDYISKSTFVNDSLYQTYLSYFPSPFPEHSLASKDPISLDCWDYEKNKPLTPENFTPFASYEAWWKCDKNTSHIWKKKLSSRKLGETCPFCIKDLKNRELIKRHGLKEVSGSTLPDLYPNLVLEWSDKNVNSIDCYSPGSGFKAIWECKFGHEWESAIYSRTKSSSNCPVCAGQVAAKGGSFMDIHPDVAKLWDWSMNGSIDPTTLVTGSSKKVSWRCTVANDHIWSASIRDVVKRPKPCPFCAESKPSSTYNFALSFPELVKFWHPSRNDLMLTEVLPKSKTEVWWICPTNPDHIYKKSIINRVRHVGCEKCGRRTKHD